MGQCLTVQAILVKIYDNIMWNYEKIYFLNFDNQDIGLKQNSFYSIPYGYQTSFLSRNIHVTMCVNISELFYSPVRLSRCINIIFKQGLKGKHAKFFCILIYYLSSINQFHSSGLMLFVHFYQLHLEWCH